MTKDKSRSARAYAVCTMMLLAGWVSQTVASPVLTLAASTAGFTLSQFAFNFPITANPCCGPLGIAFPGGQQVMVSDYPGNVRIFPTDVDGQNATSFAPAQNYGSGNGVGLATVGTHVYMTEQSAGQVIELNSDGTFNQVIVTGIPTATGIVAILRTVTCLSRIAATTPESGMSTQSPRQKPTLSYPALSMGSQFRPTERSYTRRTAAI